MPKNPFGQDDPLAGGGGGTGIWGAAAAGFGQVQQAVSAVPKNEYDVVEIAEAQPPAAPSAKGGKEAKASTSKGAASSLAAREAELAKREQELRRKEAALATVGGTVDHRLIANFPPCLPMVHHDIRNDIPESNQGIMRAGLWIFLLTMAALAWNFVAVLVGTILSGDVTVASCFFATLYMVVGIPGAWYTWYGRLYAAMQTDGALSFAGFFFTFFIHCAFSIWSAVSPDLVNGQDYAHTGWLPALALFKVGLSGPGNKFSGILYMVGAGLWSAVSFFSVTYMARVYAKMRGGNMSERARQEAIQLGARMAMEEMTRKNRTGGK